MTTQGVSAGFSILVNLFLVLCNMVPRDALLSIFNNCQMYSTISALIKVVYINLYLYIRKKKSFFRDCHLNFTQDSQKIPTFCLV